MAMIRLLLIVCIVCSIAYLSPTRERTDAAAQVGAAMAGVETFAAVASSSFGQHAIEEAVRRPHAPAADTQADRLANAPERHYK